MTAIHDYLRNKFALEGLETLSELNGSKHNQLPQFLIRRLEERTIRCLRIDSTVDAQVKFDIFERLNSGSLKLEAQELRNATARGPFNDMIKEMAKNSDFRYLIQVNQQNEQDNSKVLKMEDAELVLRFFALRQGRYRNLKKGFKNFLTSSQVEFNKIPESKLKIWRAEFSDYMKFIREHGGNTPFGKWRLEGTISKRMSSFNAAVFDAVAVGLSEAFTIAELRSKATQIAKRLARISTLFGEAEFFSSVSGSVNDAAKVTYRIETVKHFLQNDNSAF